jgi:hypothetical protein
MTDHQSASTMHDTGALACHDGVLSTAASCKDGS